MSQRIPIAAARRNLAGVVARSAKGERIKLTRYNQSLAVLIPKKDLEELERCQEESRASGGAKRPARRTKRA